jgi:CheY-like chemotaxis protein
MDQAGHTLRLQLPPGPVRLDADPVRLAQVFSNLLNNAAKYTPTGGRIELFAGVSGEWAELRVVDNGKGIEAGALERIFDLFIQLEPNATGTFGGLGVGLALVRRIVDLHGGSVQAYSDGPGMGSEFVVKLPLSGSQVAASQVPAEQPAAARSLRILVVDDNVDAADSLAALLQQLGHRAETAYDGATALRVVPVLVPHLLLLDIGMPRMSGYDLARAVSAMELDPRPIIAAVTGWGQPADKERARQAGFHRHFTKPVSETEIRRLLVEVAGDDEPA